MAVTKHLCCMKNTTLIEGESFDPGFNYFGYAEFTRKVLRLCKNKKEFGLLGTIKLIDAEPSKRLFIENEAGRRFTIRYMIEHTCSTSWAASYSFYTHCPETDNCVAISDGYARAKYCKEYLED